jgi:hypothetical protein
MDSNLARALSCLAAIFGDQSMGGTDCTFLLIGS